MNRYKIALGKKPKEVKIKKEPLKSDFLRLKRSYFIDVKVMVDYMTEVGSIWIPENGLYFEDEILIGYKFDGNIVFISAVNYQKTKSSLSKPWINKIDKGRVIYL